MNAKLKRSTRDSANASAASKVPGAIAQPPSRRATRRDRFRVEAIEASLALFKKRGYDATTVSDIAEEVGISSRTFFRHFNSKEDLVFDWVEQQGEFATPILAARPSTESPFEAMEQTFLQLSEYHDANRKTTSFMTHLIFETPNLAGRYHSEHDKWQEAFVEILMKARGLKRDDLFTLRVQVSAAVTTFVTAIRHWAADSNQTPLRPWVSTAFAALHDRPLKEKQRS